VLPTENKKRNILSGNCEWFKKSLYIHALRYPTIKTNELQMHATHGFVSNANVMLRERSQTQQAEYCVVPLMRHSGKGKTVRTENK
jgi:hypothetical protein